jgi:peroxiredoxin-like protein
MAELTFKSNLTWTGGRLSRGTIEAGGESFQFSVPASMGGLGAGTNPEELLLSAVGSCFTATLAGTLEAGRLPVSSLEVRVDGTVSDYPGPAAKVSAITVNPTFRGVEFGREGEYENAARKARERCFIGRHLGPQVAYGVGEIAFEEAEAATA